MITVEKRNDKETKDAVDKQCEQSRHVKTHGDEEIKNISGSNNELQENVGTECRVKDNEVKVNNNRIQNKITESQQTGTPSNTATYRRYNEPRNDDIDRANGNSSDNEKEFVSPRKHPEEQQVHKNFTMNEINSEKEKEKNAHVEETKEKDGDFQDTNDDGKSSEKPTEIRTQKKKNWNKVKNAVKATSRRKNSNGFKTSSKLGKLKENHEASVDLEETSTQNILADECDLRNKTTDIKDKDITEPLNRSSQDPHSDTNHTTVDIKDVPEKKQVNNLPNYP